ncbi:MAG: Crp/Fnr family transcriptional regulator [Phenylobacterium sp.]|uniref:Crp/Fnr family transcriptional regulator n=1 Tax=Phenylobacterium sp. TaxID=1871053 RepID=UPI001A5A63EA|nr:Crp/Fnr family transcriptional regulator [Phenylobacterium sp.]MBL8773492.1 Crp/Fnr family transcriptional regulator [Phenylobacterium sp.]
MSWIDTLPCSARDALLSAGRRRDYPAGAQVYGLGDSPGGLYRVQTGSARIYLGGADGQILILRLSRAGDVFGQTVALDGAPAPIFVEARTPLSVLFFPQAELSRLQMRHPEILEGLSRQAATTIRGLMAALQELALMPLPMRLLSRLRALSRDAPAAEGWSRVDISQWEVTAMLAASRPAVNKALRSLERDGAVRLGRGWIEMRSHG